jgi:signal transduction histidine kinase
MKNIFFVLLFFQSGVLAQTRQKDSLQNLIKIEKSDTAKIRLLNLLAQLYEIDTANIYLQEAVNLSNKSDYEFGRLVTLTNLSFVSNNADYPKALGYALSAHDIAERRKDTGMLLRLYTSMTLLYRELQDANMMLEYTKKRDMLLQSWANKPVDEKMNQFKIQVYNAYGYSFTLLNRMDSARFYRRLAYQTVIEQKDQSYTTAFFAGIGLTYIDENPDSALYYFRLALLREKTNKSIWMGRIGTGMGRTFYKKGLPDSALYYFQLGFINSREAKQIRDETDASIFLHQLYATQNQLDSAYKYLLISSSLKDSVFGIEKIKEIQQLNYNERSRITRQTQAKINAQEKSATNLKLLSLAGGLAALSIFVLFLFRSNKQKQKVNFLLHEQNTKINLQKSKTENALENLRSTQQQLIQKEKMASLGELTAGIAHEIQNPLNFVNNFSDVNKELLAEMKDEIAKGNYDEVKAIANDVMDNQEKINQHGKKADGIVKGMLQHSRSSSAVKEPTDINKLADEYLRLAYHGLRAKDKSFNAVLKTDYDETIGNINIIPQDIGRVILNLITNAFYAIGEKKKSPHPLKGGMDYEPIVTVTTKKFSSPSAGGDGGIEVRIKDNGNGIPQNIVDKIFQPFFTTKPTGQGTGLGLSLSYDIVKAHGGELKVKTKEGEGAEFIIFLCS